MRIQIAKYYWSQLARRVLSNSPSEINFTFNCSFSHEVVSYQINILIKHLAHRCEYFKKWQFFALNWVQSQHSAFRGRWLSTYLSDSCAHYPFLKGCTDRYFKANNCAAARIIYYAENISLKWYCKWYPNLKSPTQYRNSAYMTQFCKWPAVEVCETDLSFLSFPSPHSQWSPLLYSLILLEAGKQIFPMFRIDISCS